MKKLLFFAFLLATQSVYTQPVIINGDNIASPGFSSPVSIGTPLAGVGSGGADQLWDFSEIIYTPVGDMEVIVPAESPIGASFPTSDYAYSFVTGFSFFEVRADKMEVLAYVITTPGVGNDYTPNPRTVLKFPFSYLESETDDWQKVGDSPNNVVLTYDGYGTLITPTKTYTDVIRIKEDYGGGAIDYQWYITDPLMSIFIFDHNTITLYNIDAEQNTTAIEDQGTNFDIIIFPNPATTYFEIQFKDLSFESAHTLDIYNIFGELVAQKSITTNYTSIDINNLESSVYIYRLHNENGTIKSGKLVVE